MSGRESLRRRSHRGEALSRSGAPFGKFPWGIRQAPGPRRLCCATPTVRCDHRQGEMVYGLRASTLASVAIPPQRTRGCQGVSCSSRRRERSACSTATRFAPGRFYTAVDHTDERNARKRIALGVSVLGAPGTSACARRSWGPTRNPRSPALPGGSCQSPLLVGRLVVPGRLPDRAPGTGACPLRRWRHRLGGQRPRSCPLEPARWCRKRDALTGPTACATASQPRPAHSERQGGPVSHRCCG
jgi:hypothetical protein